MTKYVSVLTFLVPAIAIASVGTLDPREAKERSKCVPPQQWVIGNVRLDDTRATMYRKLGKPIRSSNGVSEDDGGQYKTTRYFYKQLEVVFGCSGIESIETSSKKVSVGSGVHVGMNESQVGEILGFTSENETGTYHVRFENCKQPSLDQFVLVFAPSSDAGDAKSRLKTVALTRFGP